jgi:ATP-dependent protease ClpP protease subunit
MPSPPNDLKDTAASLRQLKKDLRSPVKAARGDWWEIRASATPDEAEVLIYGDIGESWYGDSVTAKQLVEALAELGKVTKIRARINSYGGSVSDGIAIYNALNRHPGGTEIHVDGVAVSIASLIAMAGQKTTMAENALMMIHAPWGAAMGNSQDMREMADTLDKYAMAMSSSYAKKAGIDLDATLALLTDGMDHWYTAAEAQSAGFADEISQPLALAAHAFPNRFSRPAGHLSTLPEHQTMPNETQPAATANPTPASPPEPNHDEIRAELSKQIQAKEKFRREEIRQAFARFTRHDGVQAILDAALDDSELTVETARAQLLDHLGRDSAPANPPGYTPRIEAGITDEQNFVAGVTQALRARAGLEKRDPQNPWASYRLFELARASLEKRGVKTGVMAERDIARMALQRRPKAEGSPGQTTSDFPTLLENVLHKELVNAYVITPDVWSKICRIGSVSDYRVWNRLVPGFLGSLDGTNEAGEYKQKAIPDAVKETIQASRFGNLISITPEAIVNDDLQFFSSLPQELGRAAKLTIEKAFFTLLTSNSSAGPVMNEDGYNLFNVSVHKNYVTSGAAPSVTTIDAGRQAMAAQTDISGNEILDIKPTIWLGPLSLGATARVVNGSTYDPDASNKLQRMNPVSSLFSQVIDTARLSAGWYMFADPAIMPTFEVVFLNGQSEPRLAQEEEFGTGGLRWRVEHTFGIGAIGWRGAYFNDGS